jgi:hypothetical protein
MVGLPVFCALALLVFLLGATYPALAQSPDEVRMTMPDTSNFPNLSFYFGAYDGSGNFVGNLQPQDVQVWENDIPRPPSELVQVEPGLQFSVAFNTGPFFTTPTGEMNLFQKVQAALLAWVQARPQNSLDDFSLVTNTGLNTTHSSRLVDWQKALQEYQPDLLNEKPQLTSLTAALDLATDPLPRPNMKRAILYITPLPAQSYVQALPNLAERARLQGIRIFVWLLASADMLDSEQVTPLRFLAERTGGQLMAYTGAEELPDMESYLQPLRPLYRLSYLSTINKSGAHRLSVLVFKGNFRAQSAEKLITLAIEPPNPIFLAPPNQVQRSLEKAVKGKLAQLTPIQTPIRILIEFPDGYPRPLRFTRLYVDGIKVAENTRAPFDRFDWQLSAYTASGVHSLKVEAEDILGLSRTSIDTNVDVVVEQPRPTLFNLNISWQRFTIAGSVLLAVTGVAVVLTMRGKRRRNAAAVATARTRQRRAAHDPVTQPVNIRQDGLRPNQGATMPVMPRTMSSDMPAWLLLLSEDGRPMPNFSVPLQHSELTFGSDPRQAGQLINDPSVSGLHARLSRTNDGDFILSDAGSVAGTWVNYAPISTLGTHLKHGDLISLGRVSFRFELNHPGHVRQPVVLPVQERR